MVHVYNGGQTDKKLICRSLFSMSNQKQNVRTIYEREFFWLKQAYDVEKRR